MDQEVWQCECCHKKGIEPHTHYTITLTLITWKSHPPTTPQVVRESIIWGFKCIALHVVQGSNTTWFPTCPLVKQFSNYAFPGQVFLWFSWLSWQATCLSPLPIEQVKIKSACNLPIRKVYLPHMTEGHLFRALSKNTWFLTYMYM